MSNPDSDFPNDPDRFTKYPPEPLPEVLDTEGDLEPMEDVDPVPFGLEQEAASNWRFGLIWPVHKGPPDLCKPQPKTWAQEVEEESAALPGPAEKPSSLVVVKGPLAVTMPLEGDYIIEADPWPPLSREQVVELHKALVEFVDGMAQPLLEAEDMALHAGVLAMRLQRLNIGTQAPKPAVKHNCWTCQLWRSENRNGHQRLACFSRKSAVVPWIEAHIPRGAVSPSHSADNCPGWTPKS